MRLIIVWSCILVVHAGAPFKSPEGRCIGCSASGSQTVHGGSPRAPEVKPGNRYWWEGSSNPFTGCSKTGGCVNALPHGEKPDFADRFKPKKTVFHGSRPSVAHGSKPAVSHRTKPAVSHGSHGSRLSLSHGSQQRPGSSSGGSFSSPGSPDLSAMQPMGVCPANFACINWQLCDQGKIIADGTGIIDKTKRFIPFKIRTTYKSCGTDIFCCGIPDKTGLTQPQTPSLGSLGGKPSKFSPHTPPLSNLKSTNFQSTSLPGDQTKFSSGLGITRNTETDKTGLKTKPLPGTRASHTSKDHPSSQQVPPSIKFSPASSLGFPDEHLSRFNVKNDFLGGTSFKKDPYPDGVRERLTSQSNFPTRHPSPIGSSFSKDSKKHSGPRLQIKSSPGIPLPSSGPSLQIKSSPGINLPPSGPSLQIKSSPGIPLLSSGPTMKIKSSPGIPLPSSGPSLQIKSLPGVPLPPSNPSSKNSFPSSHKNNDAGNKFSLLSPHSPSAFSSHDKPFDPKPFIENKQSDGSPPSSSQIGNDKQPERNRFSSPGSITGHSSFPAKHNPSDPKPFSKLKQPHGSPHSGRFPSSSQIDTGKHPESSGFSLPGTKFSSTGPGSITGHSSFPAKHNPSDRKQYSQPKQPQSSPPLGSFLSSSQIGDKKQPESNRFSSPGTKFSSSGPGSITGHTSFPSKHDSSDPKPYSQSKQPHSSQQTGTFPSSSQIGTRKQPESNRFSRPGTKFSSTGPGSTTGHSSFPGKQNPYDPKPFSQSKQPHGSSQSGTFPSSSQFGTGKQPEINRFSSPGTKFSSSGPGSITGHTSFPAKHDSSDPKPYSQFKQPHSSPQSGTFPSSSQIGTRKQPESNRFSPTGTKFSSTGPGSTTGHSSFPVKKNPADPKPFSQSKQPHGYSQSGPFPSSSQFGTGKQPENNRFSAPGTKFSATGPGSVTGHSSFPAKRKPSDPEPFSQHKQSHGSPPLGAFLSSSQIDSEKQPESNRFSSPGTKFSTTGPSSIPGHSYIPAKRNPSDPKPYSQSKQPHRSPQSGTFTSSSHIGTRKQPQSNKFSSHGTKFSSTGPGSTTGHSSFPVKPKPTDPKPFSQPKTPHGSPHSGTFSPSSQIGTGKQPERYKFSSPGTAFSSTGLGSTSGHSSFPVKQKPSDPKPFLHPKQPHGSPHSGTFPSLSQIGTRKQPETNRFSSPATKFSSTGPGSTTGHSSFLVNQKQSDPKPFPQPKQPHGSPHSGTISSSSQIGTGKQPERNKFSSHGTKFSSTGPGSATGHSSFPVKQKPSDPKPFSHPKQPHSSPHSGTFPSSSQIGTRKQPETNRFSSPGTKLSSTGPGSTTGHSSFPVKQKQSDPKPFSQPNRSDPKPYSQSTKTHASPQSGTFPSSSPIGTRKQPERNTFSSPGTKLSSTGPGSTTGHSSFAVKQKQSDPKPFSQPKQPYGSPHSGTFSAPSQIGTGKHPERNRFSSPGTKFSSTRPGSTTGHSSFPVKQKPYNPKPFSQPKQPHGSPHLGTFSSSSQIGTGKQPERNKFSSPGTKLSSIRPGSTTGHSSFPVKQKPYDPKPFSQPKQPHGSPHLGTFSSSSQIGTGKQPKISKFSSPGTKFSSTGPGSTTGHSSFPVKQKPYDPKPFSQPKQPHGSPHSGTFSSSSQIGTGKQPERNKFSSPGTKLSSTRPGYTTGHSSFPLKQKPYDPKPFSQHKQPHGSPHSGSPHSGTFSSSSQIGTGKQPEKNRFSSLGTKLSSTGPGSITGHSSFHAKHNPSDSKPHSQSKHPHTFTHSGTFPSSSQIGIGKQPDRSKFSSIGTKLSSTGPGSVTGHSSFPSKQYASDPKPYSHSKKTHGSPQPGAFPSSSPIGTRKHPESNKFSSPGTKFSSTRPGSITGHSPFPVKQKPSDPKPFSQPKQPHGSSHPGTFPSSSQIGTGKHPEGARFSSPGVKFSSKSPGDKFVSGISSSPVHESRFTISVPDSDMSSKFAGIKPGITSSGHGSARVQESGHSSAFGAIKRPSQHYSGTSHKTSLKTESNLPKQQHSQKHLSSLSLKPINRHVGSRLSSLGTKFPANSPSVDAGSISSSKISPGVKFVSGVSSSPFHESRFTIAVPEGDANSEDKHSFKFRDESHQQYGAKGSLSLSLPLGTKQYKTRPSNSGFTPLKKKTQFPGPSFSIPSGPSIPSNQGSFNTQSGSQSGSPMMGGMMMPVRTLSGNIVDPGSSCSAGSYCVTRSDCNAYTGIIILNRSQLSAVRLNSPKVPEVKCFLPHDPGLQDGVCCKLPALVGPDGKPID